jgi:hypothetical protein
MYVGSSSTLARRLIGYFNGTHKNTGKLIPLIKSEGIGAFKLQVIPLIEFYSVNQELSLEQYFLLHPEYNLNVLKVVNDFSGAFVGGGLGRSIYNVLSGYTSNIKKKVSLCREV